MSNPSHWDLEFFELTSRVNADAAWPHVDQQSDGVSHVDRTRDSVSAEAVAWADLHEALGRREGEDHWVSGVGSEQGTGRVIWDIGGYQGGS